MYITIYIYNDICSWYNNNAITGWNTSRRELHFESGEIKRNFDGVYTVSIDLAPNEIPYSAKYIGKVGLQYSLDRIIHFPTTDLAQDGIRFGAKCIGKVWLQSKFCLIWADWEWSSVLAVAKAHQRIKDSGPSKSSTAEIFEKMRRKTSKSRKKKLLKNFFGQAQKTCPKVRILKLFHGNMPEANLKTKLHRWKLFYRKKLLISNLSNEQFQTRQCCNITK